MTAFILMNTAGDITHHPLSFFQGAASTIGETKLWRRLTIILSARTDGGVTMSSGAMTVVRGTPSLHILDHDVILDLLAIATIGNPGVTGVYLTETLHASATQHIPHHPTCLGLHFAQDIPWNLFHLFQNPLRPIHHGKRRLHQTSLLSQSNQAWDIFLFHKSHQKFCATPQ
jgi:hypothetical protein